VHTVAFDGRHEVSRALGELLHKKTGKTGAVFEQPLAGSPVQHCNVCVAYGDHVVLALLILEERAFANPAAPSTYSEGNTKILDRVPRPRSPAFADLSFGTHMHGLSAMQRAPAEEGRWRRLDGHHHLPRIIKGVKFADGAPHRQQGGTSWPTA
jgi:hypothetical protein